MFSVPRAYGCRLLLLLLLLCAFKGVWGQEEQKEEEPIKEEGAGQEVQQEGEKAVSNDYEEDSEEYPGEEDSCHPEMADRCFLDVNDNLLCHLEAPPGGPGCARRTPRDLCLSLEDALNCTGSVVDTGCSVGRGRDNFDLWLKGLQAVHRHLCVDDPMLLLVTELLNSGRCWKLKKFLNCVEDKTNLTHVNDLLTTSLTMWECSQVQAALVTCNANAEKNNWQCRDRAGAVTEALIVFFHATACGQSQTVSTSPAPPDCTSPPTAVANTQVKAGSSVSAVVVTVVVVVVVVAMLLAILVHRKLITVHPPELKLTSSWRSTAPAPEAGGGSDGGLYDRF